MNSERTVSDRTAEGLCPVCGEPKDNYRLRRCYEGFACDACRASLMARRAAAYLFDTFVLPSVMGFLVVFVGLVVIGLELDPNNPVTIAACLLVIPGLFPFGWLTKDGWFRGQSPGKAIFGIRAVAAKTGKPVSLLMSFVRNIPLMIPLVPLVVAIQICIGSMRRLGDGMAGTKVTFAKPRGAFADR